MIFHRLTRVCSGRAPLGVSTDTSHNMDTQELVAALSETRKPRASLYLNEERIGDLFSQQVGAIRDIVRSEKFDAKISAFPYADLRARRGERPDSQRNA